MPLTLTAFALLRLVGSHGVARGCAKIFQIPVIPDAVPKPGTTSSTMDW